MGGQKSGLGLFGVRGEPKKYVCSWGSVTVQVDKPRGSQVLLWPGLSVVPVGRSSQAQGPVAWEGILNQLGQGPRMKGGPSPGDGLGWEGELAVRFAAALS